MILIGTCEGKLKITYIIYQYQMLIDYIRLEVAVLCCSSALWCFVVVLCPSGEINLSHLVPGDGSLFFQHLAQNLSRSQRIGQHDPEYGQWLVTMRGDLKGGSGDKCLAAVTLGFLDVDGELADKIIETDSFLRCGGGKSCLIASCSRARL